MNSFRKMLELAHRLDDNNLLIPSAQRVEIKRTRSGHFRLYIACGANVRTSAIAQLYPLVEGQGISPNPFVKAGLVTAVTFVDDDEDGPASQDNAQSPAA